MSLELRKRIILHNKEGEVTYDSGDLPSHSFVKGFMQGMQLIYGNVVEPRPLFKTAAGALYTVTVDTIWTTADYPFSVDNDLDDDKWGILIGDDDTTPEENDNFRLDSLIESGAGAGQVNYGVTSWDPTITIDGNEVRWSFNRPMTNNSGGNVVVKEIGVYVRIYGTTPIHYVMILRDIINPAITIPNGETMTVQYTIKTDVTV